MDIWLEPVTDAEREFLMPIVRYLEILLEWTREQATATLASDPYSDGQSQAAPSVRKPRGKKSSRRL